MSLSPGKRLGTYEVMAALGAGGMGEVYRARDTALGRDVAIKVLSGVVAHDAERLRRFKQEAQAAAALNHPNIVAIHHIGEQDGTPYIVSELLEGATLRQRMLAGPLPVRKCIDLAMQIVHGLAAAHEKGIVHRDLKPENIWVTEDGKAKILDFGLAKLTHTEGAAASTETPTLTQGSEPGLVLGTAGYMSPEQVRGRAVDARSDLFSFGAILYEMLSGKRAFHGDTVPDTMSAILKEDPTSLRENRNIAPALEGVVSHCLEKNPNERFQSARDLAFDLAMLLGVSSSAALQHPATTTVFSRSRLMVALIALVLLGALSAGIFLGQHRSQPAAPKYQRLTFRRGTILSARFAPDGHMIMYSAAWDGKPYEIFATRSESPESRPLGLEGSSLLSLSAKGEMAILQHVRVVAPLVSAGTLARLPMEGGAPRQILPNVESAEWGQDGTSLALVHEVGGRDHLEFPAGKLIYETGGWIGHARLSPQGDRIAFLDHPVRGSDNGSVAVVDLSGNRRTLSTGWTDLTGLAWSPGGKEIWFSGTRTGGSVALLAVTPVGRERQLAKIPGDLTLFDVGADGRALVGREDWRGECYGLSAGEIEERNLSWFDFSVPSDLSQDGKILLFYEFGEAGGPNLASYLRRMDASPPVRLSDGMCHTLSRDGEMVICSATPGQLIQVPTKTGEPRPVLHDQLNHLSLKLFPDEKRIVSLAFEAGHGTRLYVQDAGGGQPRAITPEGANEEYAVSPDGNEVAGTIGGEYEGFLFPANGGDPRPIPGFKSGDLPIRWAEDGRFLYVYRFEDLPARVYQIEFTTGRRRLWKQLMPPDTTGVILIEPILLAADRKSYVYGLNRKLHDLYLVEGLK